MALRVGVLQGYRLGDALKDVQPPLPVSGETLARLPE